MKKREETVMAENKRKKKNVRSRVRNQKEKGIRDSKRGQEERRQ